MLDFNLNKWQQQGIFWSESVNSCHRKCYITSDVNAGFSTTVELCYTGANKKNQNKYSWIHTLPLYNDGVLIYT